MNFEILVEGQGELTTLSILMEKIVGPYGQPHTWKIHKHRGIGKLPDDPKQKPNKKNSTLLHNLPSKLMAYAKEMKESDVVVVLVDLDDRPDCRAFKAELVDLLNLCRPQPNNLFRIAIEELEAWLLGDRPALCRAYPAAKDNVLNSYVQDDSCGTWEKLADAVYPGGMASLASQRKRSPLVLARKLSWAKKIAPHMDVENNQSPSFQQFRDGLRQFTT